MYSLGIIFFEMCYLPMVGMQKADVIGKLRRPEPLLPSDFKPSTKTETDIVLSLINHNPKERPSSAELLKSGKLPVQMESETIRRTLAGLADPSSPYYGKMLSTLFARPVDAAKDFAWDMLAASPNLSELLNQGMVRSSLISIFRRHGALEMNRSSIYPRSAHYADNVVPVLDQNGTVLQLPYDLTMGNARMVAKQSSGPLLQRTFSFGNVFRDKQDTGQPQMFGEVDFDIVTTDTQDLALKEAEVLKVLDEIVHTFPSLSLAQMCFHVGHSDLLQLIFEYCGIEPACRRPAADVLSRLNIHNNTWQKIRVELRSAAVGLSATSVDELQRFDFRGELSILHNIFANSPRFAKQGLFQTQDALRRQRHVPESVVHHGAFERGRRVCQALRRDDKILHQSTQQLEREFLCGWNLVLVRLRQEGQGRIRSWRALRPSDQGAKTKDWWQI